MRQELWVWPLLSTTASQFHSTSLTPFLAHILLLLSADPLPLPLSIILFHFFPLHLFPTPIMPLVTTPSYQTTFFLILHSLTLCYFDQRAEFRRICAQPKDDIGNLDKSRNQESLGNEDYNSSVRTVALWVGTSFLANYAFTFFFPPLEFRVTWLSVIISYRCSLQWHLVLV